MTHNTSIILHGECFHVLLESEQIENRIAELASKLNEDYRGLLPVFLVVLKGAFLFGGSLMKNITVPCEISFVKLESYKSKESTGQVHNAWGLTDQLRGRHVVVVEDIVDTGLSMAYLLEMLEEKQPASLRIAALLRKPKAVQVKDVAVAYVGFEIDDRFVVGYGLDYNGLGRNLPQLYVSNER